MARRTVRSTRRAAPSRARRAVARPRASSARRSQSRGASSTLRIVIDNPGAPTVAPDIMSMLRTPVRRRF